MVATSPGQAQGGLNLGRHLQDPLRSVRAEASGASTAESISAGQLVVVVRGRHGEFVIPGLVAVDTFGRGAQHSEEIIGVLRLGGLASGERDEFQNGDEFEGSDGQQSSGRQSDEIRVGGCLCAAENAETRLVDNHLAVVFEVAERHYVDLLSEQLPALPGAGRFADSRQHRVEVHCVVSCDGDVDVVGRAAGERDASKDERKVSGGGTDQNLPARSAQGIDQGIQ